MSFWRNHQADESPKAIQTDLEMHPHPWILVLHPAKEQHSAMRFQTHFVVQEASEQLENLGSYRSGVENLTGSSRPRFCKKCNVRLLHTHGTPLAALSFYTI